MNRIQSPLPIAKHGHIAALVAAIIALAGFANAVSHAGVGGRSGFSPARSRSHRLRNDALIYPLGYDDGLYDAWSYDEALYDGAPASPDELTPPVMVMQAGKAQQGATNPAGPKVIELPGAADSKPLPPAMFILTSGERIEAQQYLLTYDRVQLTVDGQQLSIPSAMLDISATLDADRQRGIDLRIPAGQSEITLGF